MAEAIHLRSASPSSPFALTDLLVFKYYYTLSNSDGPTAIPKLLTYKEACSGRYRKLMGAEWMVVDWGVP